MTRKFLICLNLLFFLISQSPCLAQGGWNKRYFFKEVQISQCRDVIEAPDGNLIMSGLTSDSLGVTRMCIVGADSIGKIIWRKQYGTYAFQYIYSDFSSRGPLLKDGLYFYHAISVRDSNNRVFGALLKFNYSGDTLWQRIYKIESPKDICIQGLAKSVDGGFLLTGFSQNWSDPGRTCIVIKTNANGEEMWRQRISKNHPNVQDGGGILQDTATKRIIITGYQYILTGTESETFGNVLILDSLGSKIKQTTFNNASGAGFRDVIQLRDKHFLTCGAFSMNEYVGIYTKKRPFVAKFDINGELLWSKMFDTSSVIAQLTVAYELENGDILLGGYIDTLRLYNISGPVRMVLYRIDKNGNLLWSRYVGNATTKQQSQYMHSLNPTKDKGFVIAVRNPNYPVPSPFDVVRVDSLGCDSTVEYCKVRNEVGLVENGYREPDSFRFYPNPAKAGTCISFILSEFSISTITIQNITGQIIASQTCKGSCIIKLPPLPIGVYLTSITCADHSFKRQKLIISN